MSTPKKPVIKTLFGQAAVERGFCTTQDVERALKIQQEQDRIGERHRLLGIIMIGEGLLSTANLIEMLQEEAKRPEARGRPGPGP